MEKISWWNTSSFTFWRWKDSLSLTAFLPCDIKKPRRTSWTVLGLVQYLNSFNYCDELHAFHWSPYLPQSSFRLFILPSQSTKFEVNFCLLVLITNQRNQNEVYMTNLPVCFTVIHGNVGKVFWQHANRAAASKRHSLYKKQKKQASCSYFLGKTEATWEKGDAFWRKCQGREGNGI